MASQIIIGDESSPLFSFNDDNIVSGSVLIDTSISIVGEELTSDQFEAEVYFEDDMGTLRGLAWATPVIFYFNGALSGKFFSTKVVRTGTTKYKIYATSAYGILDYKTYYGGIWNGEKFGTVVENILLSDGIAKFKKGYYTKLYRGEVGDMSNTPTALAVYSLGQKQTAYNREFPEYNNMCRLTAKFTLGKFIQGLSGFETLTSTRIALIGQIHKQGGYYPELNYGMYMDISRSSVNDDWPDFGEVFVTYSNSTYSLGTPTEPTTYEIDINPSLSIATVNGTDYSITFSGSSPYYYARLGNYGGGAIAATTTIQKPYEVSKIPINATFEYLRIYDEVGYLLSDFVSVVNAFTNQIYAFDLCTGMYSSNYPCYYGEVKEEDYTENVNPLVYPIAAMFPVIEEDTFTREILDSIAYENEIGDLPVYGWIDICSKREAFHQLLFAMGVILKKDALGNILFTYPTNTTAATISSDDIFDNGTEEFTEHTNSIEVSEHSYCDDETLSEETVYENKDAPSSESYYATFKSKPILADTVKPTSADLVLLDNNCNAAVLYGSGSLTGKKYSQNTVTVVRSIANYDDGKTVTVKDATLVTAQNSASIADKLEAYYGNARKVKNAFVVNGETCGLQYAFENPFNENVTGFLTKMTQKPSSILRTESEFICNYIVPSGTNVDYTNYVVLTGNGTWQVPQSVFEKDTPRIRVVLIGGGTGGSSGKAGETGEVPDYLSGSTAASGGMGGNSGVGGNIYEVVIDNPVSSYSYSCGVGGEGGAISTSTSQSNIGYAGTDTSFIGGQTTISSALGAKSANGYRNFFTGEIYAKPYDNPYWNTEHITTFSGLSYGKGGRGGYVYVIASGSYVKIDGGQSIDVLSSTIATGGSYGNNYPVTGNFRALGGTGGGGALGGTAQKGGDASSSKAGNGGNGANAEAIPPKMTDYKESYYGYGGCGGYGGGGGGSAGTPGASGVGVGGSGGYGGKGGTGGDGCVLIYY